MWSRKKKSKFFDGNQVFYIFYFLLHPLALEVKDSKNFHILRKSLVHSDQGKSLAATQKQKPLKFIYFLKTLKQTKLLYFPEKIRALSLFERIVKFLIFSKN